MKLSSIKVKPSERLYLIESIIEAPSPTHSDTTLSYLILETGMKYGFITESMLGNLVADIRAKGRPIQNIDHILWITGPEINCNTADVIDLAKRAGHLPGSIIDVNQHTTKWWNELYELFGVNDDEERQRIRSRIEIEAQAQTKAETEEPDARQGEQGEQGEPKPSRSNRNNGGFLDNETKAMLKQIMAQHKETGDNISALIKDMRASLAKGNIKKAEKQAAEIVELGTEARNEAADLVLGSLLLEHKFMGSTDSILEHVYLEIINGRSNIAASSHAKRSYLLMLQNSKRSMVDGITPTRLNESFMDKLKGIGSKAHSRIKSSAAGLLDRLQDRTGTKIRDDEYRTRVSNVLLAKSAIAILTRLTIDKLGRLPRDEGQRLISAEKNQQTRAAARKAMGLTDIPHEIYGFADSL